MRNGEMDAKILRGPKASPTRASKLLNLIGFAKIRTACRTQPLICKRLSGK